MQHVVYKNGFLCRLTTFVLKSSSQINRNQLPLHSVALPRHPQPWRIVGPNASPPICSSVDLLEVVPLLIQSNLPLSHPIITLFIVKKLRSNRVDGGHCNYRISWSREHRELGFEVLLANQELPLVRSDVNFDIKTRIQFILKRLT